jgi:hypothetical protein
VHNASSQTDGIGNHLDDAYVRKGETGVSWFEETSTVSLDLIAGLSRPKDSLIDVGGGALRLAAHALILGFGHVAILDLSAEASARVKTASGSDADRIEWIVSNVTAWQPKRRYNLWHDRAAFHFLIEEVDRSAKSRGWTPLCRKVATPSSRPLPSAGRTFAAGCLSGAKAMKP